MRRARSAGPCGSSPRMRGKLTQRALGARIGRFIPAHAGKTPGAVVGSGGCGVHPRACGENYRIRIDSAAYTGSSPRMRGKRPPQPLDRDRRGFIPAHAGKTSPSAISRRADAVHPRACGENHGTWSRVSAVNGSSPRMRGKHVSVLAAQSARRFIPAHAGKTVSPWTRRDCGWVHPRACGENDPPANPPLPYAGSSPRMRGKRDFVNGDADALGFIPAHAGKTARPTRSWGGRRVHPRACGENLLLNAAAEASAGSSPRMRGKLQLWRGAGIRAGFIPAHAGKTWSSSS